MMLTIWTRVEKASLLLPEENHVPFQMRKRKRDDDDDDDDEDDDDGDDDEGEKKS
jgi:hypothetical protein